MIIASLTYKVPLEAVDNHLEAHREWLQEALSAGMLAVAGRKIPRTGGVLISTAPRADFEACCARDPFAVHGVADYVFTEFSPTAAGGDFAFLLR